NITTIGDINGANITAKGLKLSDDGSRVISLKVPSTLSSDTTLTLPDTAGDNGQVLQTDGSGKLNWTDVGAAGISDGGLSPAKTAIADGQIIVGNASGQGAAVALTGDISITNTGEATIGANAVTSDKIEDGIITNADINASAAIAGTKIAPNFG
ncbi:MAG TPA: hypothetical protein DC023_02775, partial [Oceanospirillaceae bacterium]|nr:hypothetical protein [Oceanospirillaceae bacterium]